MERSKEAANVAHDKLGMYEVLVGGGGWRVTMSQRHWYEPGFISPFAQPLSTDRPFLMLNQKHVVDLSDAGRLSDKTNRSTNYDYDSSSLDSLEWSTDSEISFAMAALKDDDVMVVETGAGLEEILNVEDIGRKRGGRRKRGKRKKKKKKRRKRKRGNSNSRRKKKGRGKKGKKGKENRQNARRRQGRREKRKRKKDRKAKNERGDDYDGGGGGGGGESYANDDYDDYDEEPSPRRSSGGGGGGGGGRRDEGARRAAQVQAARAREAEALADDYRRQVDAQEKQVVELERELESIRTRGDKAAEVAETCKLNAKDREAEAKDALSEAKEARRKLESYKADASKAEEKLDRKEDELQKAEDRLASVRKDSQATKDDLEQAEKDLEAKKKEYSEALEKIEEAETKLQEMNEKIETAENKIEEAKEKVEALEKVTVELTKQLEESKADVEGRVTREAEEDSRTTEALDLFAAARGEDGDAREAALDKIEELLKSLL